MTRITGQKTTIHDITWDLEELPEPLLGFGLLRRKVEVTEGDQRSDRRTDIGILNPQGIEAFHNNKDDVQNMPHRRPFGYGPLNRFGCVSGYCVLTEEERDEILKSGPVGYRDLAKGQMARLQGADIFDESIYMSPKTDLFDAFRKGQWSAEDLVHMDEDFKVMMNPKGGILPTSICIPPYMFELSYGEDFDFDHILVHMPENPKVKVDPTSKHNFVTLYPDDSDMEKILGHIKNLRNEDHINPGRIKAMELVHAALDLDLIGVKPFLEADETSSFTC